MAEKVINAREPPPRAAPNTSGECGAEANEYISTRRLCQKFMRHRTDSHTSQREIPLAIRSSRANAPVGTHKRPGPTHPGSCRGGTMSALCRGGGGSRVKMMYMLYPVSDRVTMVPLGTGNSAYTLPEVPTIGFERGRASSWVGVRATSTMVG